MNYIQYKIPISDCRTPEPLLSGPYGYLYLLLFLLQLCMLYFSHFTELRVS